MVASFSRREVRSSDFSSATSFAVKLTAVPSETRDQVGMNMENALAALKTHIYQDPVAFEVKLAGYPVHGRQKPAHLLLTLSGFRVIRQTGHMLPRHHQNMNRCFGINVVKSHEFCVLVY